MDAYRFKAIKKFDDFEGAYTFSENELMDWLRELPIVDRFSTCVKIISALQAMDEIEIEPEQRLLHLTKIKDHTSDMFKKMETVFLDSGFPMTYKEKTNIELLAWVNVEFSKNYQRIGMAANTQDLTADNRMHALNQALKHLGKCLVNIAQAYQLPFEGIWQTCYQIYKFAEQNKLLDIEVGRESTGTRTINNTFKQIMLFGLTHSNQYRPREMYKIYDTLGYFSQWSEITPDGWGHPRNECFFCIDKDQEPKGRHMFKQAKDKSTIYHFSIANVALQLYNDYVKDNPGAHGTPNIINSALMMRVVKALGLNQKRKFTRIHESRTCRGIVGFDNLVAYIRSQSGLNVQAGNSNDPRIAGQWDTPDLMLVEEGEEWLQQKEYSYKQQKGKQSSQVKKILNVAKGADSEIWQDAAVISIDTDQSADDLTSEFEVLDGSFKGYGLLWRERSLKVKIGELFGLVEESEERVEIGIIRTIRVSNRDEIRLGVELIGLESTYVDMFLPGLEKSPSSALLITSIKGVTQEDSLVYTNSDFHPGEFVDIKEGSKVTHCRLTRLLHLTSAVSHVELYYSN